MDAKQEPSLPRRKSIRLRGYDYSFPGAYFVTLCSQDKRCVFGSVVGEKVHLSPAGEIVRTSWIALPERFPRLILDDFVIMPNHFHAILGLVGAGLAPPSATAPRLQPREASPTPTKANGEYSLANIIGAFKSVTTIQVNKLLSVSGAKLWQRNYYDHVVREGEGLRKIQQYIHDNPLMWSLDPENPNRKSK